MNDSLPSRFPPWLKQDIPDEGVLSRLRLVEKLRVRTVCQEAHCPNLSHCFKNSKLTFMILGDTCTRNCRFCAVNKTDSQALTLDTEEAGRISSLVQLLGLEYVVITSVTRDDLSDGGARQFVQTIEAIRSINSNIKIEVLIPDFAGNLFSLETVISARPCVVSHNIETVRRLHKELKPRCSFSLSLQILSKCKEINPALTTKSSLILGLGEKEEEVTEAMINLRSTGCDILTLGQYLAPSTGHYPIQRFVSPEEFQRYKEIGDSLGFQSILSGPLVRSSYHAAEVYSHV